MEAPVKIILTTSRNPTPTMRAFCNDLRRVMPKAVHVNRGKMSVDEIAEKALEHEADRVIIVDRWHGGPCKIRFLTIGESGLLSIPPIISIASIRLQREFGISRIKPALSLVVLHPTASKEVGRFADALSIFLNIPILSMKAASKTNATVMRIWLGKGNRIETTFMVEPHHVEIGPRSAVSRIEWVKR